MREFIEALRNGTSYDWINENGWKFNANELLYILKEYDSAISNSLNADDIFEYLADEFEGSEY